MSEIKFERRDEDLVEIKKSSDEVADFLFNNKEFIEVFCEVLIGMSRADKYITKNIAQSIMAYKEMYSNEKLTQLKNLMEDVYMYVNDVSYDNILCQRDSYYIENNMNQPQEKLNKIRGILFESLIERVVTKRYKDNFNCGCVVFINGTKIINRYNGKCRMTIDVAGFDNIDKGEFYECKVAPNSLDEKSYLYLDHLDSSLKATGDVTYVVGCVSAGTLQMLKSKKKAIEDAFGTTNPNIILFGMDEIMNLENNPSKFDMAI